MKFLPILFLALGLLTSCSDEKTVQVANQEALLNPEVVGTNAAGKTLYRVYLHCVTAAGGEYYYYWDK